MRKVGLFALHSGSPVIADGGCGETFLDARVYDWRRGYTLVLTGNTIVSWGGNHATDWIRAIRVEAGRAVAGGSRCDDNRGWALDAKDPVIPFRSGALRFIAPTNEIVAEHDDEYGEDSPFFECHACAHLIGEADVRFDAGTGRFRLVRAGLQNTPYAAVVRFAHAIETGDETALRASLVDPRVQAPYAAFAASARTRRACASKDEVYASSSKAYVPIACDDEREYRLEVRRTGSVWKIATITDRQPQRYDYGDLRPLPQLPALQMSPLIAVPPVPDIDPSSAESKRLLRRYGKETPKPYCCDR